jgi:hypothetical protein
MESGMCGALNFPDFVVLTPKGIARMLKNDIRMTQEVLANIQEGLRLFQDVQQLKQWLKGYRIPEPEFDPFF